MSVSNARRARSAQAQHAAQLAARDMPGAAPNFQVRLLPLDTRQWIRTTNQWLLQVMLGVVALVLLIACANVAKPWPAP